MTRQGYPPFSSLGSVLIASGASTSSSLDLAQAGWSRLAVGYATFTTGAVLQVQGSADDTTYKNVNVLVTTSSTAQYQPLTIATSVSGTGYAVMDRPPFRYVRFTADATIVGGGVITVFGGD